MCLMKLLLIDLLYEKKLVSVLGVLAIVGGAGGQFLGGLTVTKLKLTVKGIIRLIIASSFVVLLCSLIFYKSCPDIR